MNRQKLDKVIKDDAELLAKTLDGTQAVIEKCNNVIKLTKIALAKGMREYKKHGDINLLLKLINIGDNEESGDMSTINRSDQLLSKIKLERQSTESQDISVNGAKVEIQKGSIKEEPNLMPPPTIRPKRGRKKGTTSSSSSGISSRSSTRKTRLNSMRESDIECTQPAVERISLSDEDSNNDEAKKKIPAPKRSKRLASITQTTVTKTEDIAPLERVETRITRSKRNQNKINHIKDEIIAKKSPNETKAIKNTAEITPDIAKDTNEAAVDDHKRSNSQNKILRSTFVNHVKKPSKSADGNTSGQTVYEDAANAPEDSCKFKMNAVVMLENINTQNEIIFASETFNKTTVISNPKFAANETVVITPKDVVLNEKKQEDFNGCEDIMTDDESPPKIELKSKVVPDGPSLTAQGAVVKKTTGVKSLENSSPVKKLVQVFEKMGKCGGEAKDRETPMNTRQMKNITPTQQNKLYTATGSAKAASYIPNSAGKTAGPNSARLGSCSATHSAVKRSQQQYQERELLRRQKEEEANRKREQLLLAQAEERRKRAEAQEFKMLQVQQKKELLSQQKLQHLDEVQRMKEEKARLVLQEKQERIDKNRENLEKKRFKCKKNQQEDGAKSAKPIYMTHPMPLLGTADCYDSDEENANVKSARVEQPWTMKDQLHPMLRVMASLDNRGVTCNLFVQKPCTPNLAEIFQDIDPAKLGRTSSAVWRKPPRYTLMHLPSFTEEAENAV